MAPPISVSSPFPVGQLPAPQCHTVCSGSADSPSTSGAPSLIQNSSPFTMPCCSEPYSTSLEPSSLRSVCRERATVQSRPPWKEGPRAVHLGPTAFSQPPPPLSLRAGRSSAGCAPLRWRGGDRESSVREFFTGPK